MLSHRSDEPYHYTETKEVSGQLAKRIVDVAYNQKTGAFNESKARELINQAFDNTIKNASNKVSDYCSANYVNYKNDDSFKKIFKASTFLRANLKSPSGVSSENHKRIQKYDEQIKKEIRSKMEALNEDWLEPILIYSGTIAIIALAVTFCIGTGGTGIPAAIAGVASLLGTIDMVISAPIIAASLYARVQTHFIEMPSQLKFNQSLAHSQLGDSSIINWDMHRNAKKEFKNQQLWQIGYMALDVFFIGSLGQHVKRTAGVVARSAYKRATGIKLRGWSAPTANMYRNIKFAEYRKTNNFFKAVGKRIGNKVDKIRLYQPRYQDMPLSMIKTTALRQGLNKVAKSSKIANKPWTLLDDMKAYSKKLAQRTTEFKAYSKAEGKVIREVYGNNIKVGELFKFGRKYSSFNFVLKSFKKAAVENRLKSYFLNFGDELNELRKMRGELIDGRVKDIQLAIDKLEDLKLAKAAKGKSLVGTGDEFSEFLSKLSDDEILALEEVVKKSPKNSLIRNFKSAFKDYNKVATGFRNPGYMKDIENMSKSAGKIIYPHTSVMGDDVVANYKFDSDAEDIVNFYESMIKQNNAKGEKVDQIRENIENGLSKFFIYDQYGNRIFNK